jgi:hypothetical protein
VHSCHPLPPPAPLLLLLVQRLVVVVVVVTSVTAVVQLLVLTPNTLSAPLLLLQWAVQGLQKAGRCCFAASCHDSTDPYSCRGGAH